MDHIYEESSIESPSQKLSDKKKGEAWHKANVDYLLQRAYAEDSRLRLSDNDMTINYNLWYDEMDPRDISRVFNPHNLPDVNDMFADIQNYSIEAPYFNLLCGEAAQRSFNYSVIILNPEFNNTRLKRKVDKIMQFVQSNIEADNFTPSQFKEEFSSLMESINFTARELEEIRANLLIRYVTKLNNIKELFLNTFWDLILVGEEVCSFEERGGQLYVEKVNPKDITVVGMGDSCKMQDADAIIHTKYMSKFQIIDRYKDVLTDADINKLESDKYNEELVYRVPTGLTEMNDAMGISEIFDLDSSGNDIGDPIKANGDIRVCRVSWKSYRQVLILYIEDDLGKITKELVDSNYEPNIEAGETVEKQYIAEWRQATLIGDVKSGIYCKMGSWIGNCYSKQNFSLITSPYIGYVYSVSNRGALPPMTQIKNLKYFYNLIMKRKEKAIANSDGNIMEMDLAYIPDREDWDFDKVLSIMKTANIKVIDSFNLAPTDGRTMAGNYNTSGKVSNMDQIQQIQTLSAILEQIKSDVGQVLGITPQRLGSMGNRETVGGIERSIVQSANTTEPLYKAHDNFKQEVHTNIMNIAKIVYNDQSVLVENVFNDTLIGMINIDGNEYASYDYGMFVSDSQEDTELRNIIKTSAPTLLQSGTIDFSTYITIMDCKDPIMARRIIAKAEEQKKLQQKAQQEQLQQIEQQKIEAAKQLEQQKRDFELTKLQIETNKDIQLKEMEIDAKIAIEEIKSDNDMKKSEDSNSHSRDMEDKKTSLAEKKMQMDYDVKKEKLNIDRNKSKTKN